MMRASVQQDRASQFSTQVHNKYAQKEQIHAPGSIQRVTTDKSSLKEKNWQLIWCHENCYKPASVDTRKMLMDTVSEAGGAISCYKKAARFLEWWSCRCKTPCILLSDWREVKPCLDGMKLSAEDGITSKLPLAICVFTQSPQVYQRASDWAKTLTDTQVTILGELTADSLKTYLNSVCGIPSPSAPEIAMQIPAPITPAVVQVQPQKQLPPPPPPAPEPKKALKSVKIKPMKGGQKWKEEQLMKEQQSTSNSWDKVETQKDTQGAPLLEFLRMTLREPENAMQIEQILLEQLPEVYEE
eukprot:TRINITY_DN40614_c0_g1_i1.p1 TRINITY_DN40614_c0_g1~~TRINITY_DN40614_c0_g1_i1.p1  ORF type:complete len:299 (-),score=83.57 TRINITY_DN40614_c0_g1_i1:159-1055(-)